MDFSLLKPGNIVRYHGGVGAFSGQNGRIVSHREDGAFIIAIKSYPKDAEHEIVAYSHDISPLHMDITMFSQLGFAQDQKTKVLTRGNVSIASFTYIKDTQNEQGEKGILYDFKGFRLITGKIPADLNEDELLANTIDVNSFHALQNYYSLNLGENLNLP